MIITSNAKTAKEFRDEVVADLKRREQMLRASIELQTTKATKAACYVAAQAIMVAAADYEGCILP
jgi:hypothetical protein